MKPHGFAKITPAALDIGGVTVTRQRLPRSEIRLVARYRGRTLSTRCPVRVVDAVALLLAAEAKKATGCPYCRAMKIQ